MTVPHSPMMGTPLSQRKKQTQKIWVRHLGVTTSVLPTASPGQVLKANLAGQPGFKGVQTPAASKGINEPQPEASSSSSGSSGEQPQPLASSLSITGRARHTMPFILPPTVPQAVQATSRDSSHATRQQHLQRLRKLREQAAPLLPNASTSCASDPWGRPGDSTLPPQAAATPQATPIGHWQAGPTFVAAPEDQPALEQLRHAAVQPPVTASKPGLVAAGAGPAAGGTGEGATAAGLSRLKHMDRLQRLRQLQREGSRLVSAM